MTGAISQDWESCQFPFVLDEKATVVAGGAAGEQSGGAQEVPYGAVRSKSERAAPSACVGKRFCFVQIVWNRSTRRAGPIGNVPACRGRSGLLRRSRPNRPSRVTKSISLRKTRRGSDRQHQRTKPEAMMSSLPGASVSEP